MSRITIATYSIVGCDLERREWGVAVQSKFLAVGAAVPCAAAEVGAIATQALANLRYGPDGLELLRSGLNAEETVDRLVAADPGRADRQLGVVDRDGGSATYTGQACMDWAGGRCGPGFAAQGNILVGAATVDALADTFSSTDGSLAERLLTSLAAGQAAGGDRRGMQAAAVLVVREGGGYGGGSDVLVDLRVDDHVEPIVELRRLFDIHQLLFGRTPREDWVQVDGALREEVVERLGRLGYSNPDPQAAFEQWVGVENLEERTDGFESLDPVVLDVLRRAGTPQ